MGKSPNGLLISQAIAVALESGLVKIYDLFGNLLTEFQVGTQGTTKIVMMQASPMQDDMFLAILTSDNTFYVYDLVLERKFNYQRDKYSEVVAQDSSNITDTTRHERGELDSNEGPDSISHIKPL